MSDQPEQSVQPSSQTTITVLMNEVFSLTDRKLFLEAQVREYAHAQEVLIATNTQQACEITSLQAALDQALAEARGATSTE